MFVVLAQSSEPSHPGEASLHNPTLGQHLELMLLVAFDHLHIVAEHLLGPIQQTARVAAIDKHFDDTFETPIQARQHGSGPHAVLNPRRMHHHRQQVALRVDGNVPLAALDLLARIVTALPPFCTVLTDCESTIATLGVELRPWLLRCRSRKVLQTRSQAPLSRQRRNC